MTTTVSDGRSVRAIVLDERDGKIEAALKSISSGDLPGPGDTTVRVLYSSLNYKDGLAVTGKGKIVRAPYPFVPGIDFVGEVESCESNRFMPGDSVIGTGWGIGENTWGGFSQLVRVRGESLVPLPEGLDAYTAMVAGTAGLTAMLALMEVEERGVDPDAGEVVVTGATGGVGSFAILFFSRSGYRAVASTGKVDAADYLRRLGAARFIPRDDLAAGARRPLDSARWTAAVDAVGGTTLEAILSQTGRHGVVASCGLAAGANFSSTVYPFILRGVSLIGIDSNTCANETRLVAWRRIGEMLDPEIVAQIATDADLSAVMRLSDDIVAGKISGRVVIDVNSEARDG